MPTLNKSAVKVKIVKIGLISRILILTSVFFLTKYGGFRLDVNRDLIFMMFPVSCVYIALFGRYIYRTGYRYATPDKKFSAGYISAGYYILWFLNVLEFLTIIYKAVHINQLPQLPLYVFLWCMLIIETVFGLIAGFYITDLFSINKTSA